MILLLLLLASASIITAQDILLKVKKGTVKIGSAMLTESSASSVIKAADIVDIQVGALVIARQDVIVVELHSGKKYTHANIADLIKKKKQASSGGFADVAFKDPIQKTVTLPQKGSSTRGLEGHYKPDFYYPYDSMLVADTIIHFIIGNKETKVQGPVEIVNINTGETIFKELGKSNRFELVNLPEGDYSWSYLSTYYTSTVNMEAQFNNLFSVASSKEKKELNKKIEALKKETKTFSHEMQKFLLLEYCVENHIYMKLD
jgi:hypothetical protein